MTSSRHTEIASALPGLLDALAERAAQERRASPGYQQLFTHIRDGVPFAAVMEAHDAMLNTAMNLCSVLQDTTGRVVDNTLFQLVLGLPLAFHAMRVDIEQNEGSACCVDKSRFLLRKLFKEKLGLEEDDALALAKRQVGKLDDNATARIQSLLDEITALKSVMIAAAEELSAHWEAHCDEEGYGPTNLLNRLEKGLPSTYGYTAGAFRALKSKLDAYEGTPRVTVTASDGTVVYTVTALSISAAQSMEKLLQAQFPEHIVKAEFR